MCDTSKADAEAKAVSGAGGELVAIGRNPDSSRKRLQEEDCVFVSETGHKAWPIAPTLGARQLQGHQG